MRIALSMRVTNAIGYDEPRDSISHDWITWLENQGHTPLPVPNCLNDAASYLNSMDAGALILTGGNDLVQTAKGPGDSSARRDHTEKILLAAAIAQLIPVFAVCRGLHVINQYFGGQVIADIPDLPVRHVAANHPVRLAEPLARIAETNEITTNSYHNQAVTLDGIGNGLHVIASSERDALAEGICHETLPILAVQWHPERPGPSAALDVLLFDRLLSQGPFWRSAD